MPANPLNILILSRSHVWIRREMLRGIYEFTSRRPNWHVRDVARFEQVGIQGLRQWPPQGLLCVDLEEELRQALPPGIPTVGILNPLAWGDVRVLLDHRAAGRIAADHLLHRGYRHFGFIHCDHYLSPRNRWSSERLAGFEEVLAVQGRSCNVFYPQPMEQRRLEGTAWLPVYTELMEWLVTLEPPVGVFCADDHLARQLMESCLGLELAVPERIGIVGVNGDPLETEWNHPKLSSVAMPWARLGYEAAARLDLLLEGMVPAEERVVLQPLALRPAASTDLTMQEDPQLSAALRYIQTQACRGIDVTQVCTATGFDRRRLERAIRKHLGRTPYQEIQRVQCEHARYLLATTRLSIREVSGRVGIQSSRFAEVFRRVTGATPRSYRQQHGTGA